MNVGDDSLFLFNYFMSGNTLSKIAKVELYRRVPLLWRSLAAENDVENYGESVYYNDFREAVKL
jgi:hypothetical protein